MEGNLQVEVAGEMIIVRFRGEPTGALLLECHERVLALMNSTGRRKVLYDVLEMTTPDVGLVLTQRQMVEEENLGDSLRRAIVVPDAKLAYLARIAFGERSYKIFYGDMASAIKWLEEA